MATTPYLAIAYIAASQNQKEVTANAAFQALDVAQNGELIVPVTGPGVTLSLADMVSAWFFKFTGSLGSGALIELPASNRQFAVLNETGQSLTFYAAASPAGAEVTIANGASALLYNDGTNILKIGS